MCCTMSWQCLAPLHSVLHFATLCCTLPLCVARCHTVLHVATMCCTSPHCVALCLDNVLHNATMSSAMCYLPHLFLSSTAAARAACCSPWYTCVHVHNSVSVCNTDFSDDVGDDHVRTHTDTRTHSLTHANTQILSLKRAHARTDAFFVSHAGKLIILIFIRRIMK
jgi:uncharacterized membrane protein